MATINYSPILSEQSLFEGKKVPVGQMKMLLHRKGWFHSTSYDCSSPILPSHE